jgi:DNA-binding NarL/FixJ family response regulator
MAKHSPSKTNPSVQAPAQPVVIVCDDHIAIRAGLKQILEGQHIVVVGECQSLDELRSVVKGHPWAVLVTDLGVDNASFATLQSVVRQESEIRQQRLAFATRPVPWRLSRKALMSLNSSKL